MHIYADFTGEVMESDEMRSQWFTVNVIVCDAMWADGKL